MLELCLIFLKALVLKQAHLSSIIATHVWMCEGKDDEKDRAKDGVYRMQVPKTAADQALQALWTWRWQEEEGNHFSFCFY